MKLKNLNPRQTYHENKSLSESFKKLQGILAALEKRNLTEEIATAVNNETEVLNTFEGHDKKLLMKIKTAENNILKLVRMKMGLIPERFYTFLWMPLGMAALGLPLGTALFTITGNAAFIGLGFPIGLGAGVMLGMGLDKKAKKENRVLIIDQEALAPDNN